MQDNKVVALYDRRLYGRLDVLLDKRRNSKTYSLIAKSDQAIYNNPAKFKNLLREHKDTEKLRDISEGWEKAGDYERNSAKRKVFYDNALSALEHLSIKQRNADENRVLMKMKNHGLIEDMSMYRKLRRQKQFFLRDLMRK